MNSHEYAERLEKLAEYLRNKPEFPLPHYMSDHYINDVWYMNEREDFIEAVRILGKGEKKIDSAQSGYIEFHPADGEGFHVRTEKSTICKLIKPAEYECDESWLHSSSNHESVQRAVTGED